MTRRNPSTAGTRLVVAALLAVGLAGCAEGHPAPARSAAPVPPPSSPVTTPAATRSLSPVPHEEASATVHPRRIGPADAGHDVTVRYGDLIQVTPPDRPGGWRVASYPKAILRPQTSTGPAAEHAFLAVAVGDGDVVLTPAAGGDPFTVHVRVLRDMVQPPPGVTRP
jgi:hypothetical protein